MTQDPFSARETIETPLGQREIFRIGALSTIADVNALPYSIKVLLEAVLRTTMVTQSRMKTYKLWPVMTRPKSRRPRLPSVPVGSYSKTSQVCRPSWILPRCDPRSSV